MDCNNCHQSVSNFVTPSTNCSDCHIHWEVGVFDHSVIGLTLNEYHNDADCESCHINSDFRIEPTCNNCHDDISFPDELQGDRVKNKIEIIYFYLCVRVQTTKEIITIECNKYH